VVVGGGGSGFGLGGGGDVVVVVLEGGGFDPPVRGRVVGGVEAVGVLAGVVGPGDDAGGGVDPEFVEDDGVGDADCWLDGAASPYCGWLPGAGGP
jgi:hypothetical protein